MRTINKIIIHSSATPSHLNIGVKEIDKWHRERKPPFSQIGYHFVIRRSGKIEKGRPVCMVGAHARGHNLHSIGICWVGGVDSKFKESDNRTNEQKHSMVKLIEALQIVFSIDGVLGHRDVGNTDCPSFDAKEEFENLLDTRNK